MYYAIVNKNDTLSYHAINPISGKIVKVKKRKIHPDILQSMNSSIDIHYFNNILPDELILEITKYLNGKDLAQLGSTCTRLRYICDPKSCIRTLTLKEFDFIKYFDPFYRNYKITNNVGEIIGFSFNGGHLYYSNECNIFKYYYDKKTIEIKDENFRLNFISISINFEKILQFVSETYEKIINGNINRYFNIKEMYDSLPTRGIVYKSNAHLNYDEYINKCNDAIYINNDSESCYYRYYDGTIIQLERDYVNIIILDVVRRYNIIKIPTMELVYFMYNCSSINRINYTWVSQSFNYDSFN